MGREGVQHREVGALGRSLVVRRETLGRQYADDHHAGPELPCLRDETLEVADGWGDVLEDQIHLGEAERAECLLVGRGREHGAVR